VERAWLERELAAGRSIESIAREVGRHSSTVAYWVNKHGLASTHAPKHAAKGGIALEELAPLVEAGMSIREIASIRGVSVTTVRHWLRRHGLRTQRSIRAAAEPSSDPATLRECRVHGWVSFRRSGSDGYYRCPKCNSRAVVERRRRVKRTLVEEAGGRCACCGYDRYPGALQFHHLDPASKRFELSHQGRTLAIARLREEAQNCVLLCANCHAEAEAGLVRFDLSRSSPG
jgi:transposase/5-methylcytosine-specific restriction endonuclease McrA